MNMCLKLKKNYVNAGTNAPSHYLPTCSYHGCRQSEHSRSRHLPSQEYGRSDDPQAMLSDVLFVIEKLLVRLTKQDEILHEAIFVTAISGFGGLIFSMTLLEVVGPHIEIDYVVNPSVNFTVAFTTVIVLVIAGTLAGFFPAWRAARVHTIEALRDE